MNRLSDIRRLYAGLDRLADNAGGMRSLADCDGRQGWPSRGVYFFFEHGEVRSDSGDAPRVVRVGTHALTAGSRASLWNRLSQHRGSARRPGSNHRGSIFRLLVGAALQRQLDKAVIESWGHKQSVGQAAVSLGKPAAELREFERDLEVEVSRRIGAMQLLWLDIPDPPSLASQRGVIERGAIALLSNWQKVRVDAPSTAWLGLASNRHHVRGSGLWNIRHVDEAYDRAFLPILEGLVARTKRPADIGG